MAIGNDRKTVAIVNGKHSEAFSCLVTYLLGASRCPLGMIFRRNFILFFPLTKTNS